MSTPYQDAQRLGQNAVRTTILDRSIALLVAEGPAALTVRRISTDIGASTKVIYTMFGGKEGLIDALYREGFARLRRTQESIPRGDDPLAHLIALGTAYRRHALAEPAYYRVMFEQPVPGYRPSPEALAVAGTAFETSTAAVAACMDAGFLRPGDAHEVSKIFWAASHGAVSLEIAGHFAPEEAGARYEALMAAVGRAYAPEPTDPEPTRDTPEPTDPEPTRDTPHTAPAGSPR
ncbi:MULTISPECIES: TetR/AcrR family transcriptional regulator [unclassified Streptomyces]|uniref:TetR/AcrR family transcriptional regulator n=1 Tax=unclassified Streptomyces TaxID=2593676 RepID=UPI000700A7DB|nr:MULTISPECIES: TetR/AcrR family transcriptional regulator [unclassified Streptomyces]KQX53040.1 TetR family transcriptional regulator [Streptomyces sp. Root1304]KRA89960.1 TetR family transcriptional regulator [Streptomyces sp. Root66D1]